MRRPLIVFITLSILLFVFAAGGAKRRAPAPPAVTSETPGHRILPPGIKGPPARPRMAALADTTVLGEWTFDDGMGGPDPQGWTTFDFSAQIDTFFHVDDFAGLGSPWVPLSGSRSLWCGSRDTPAGDWPEWESPPGYGNSWNQRFESVPFSVTGDVTMEFSIRYDSEGGYDSTYVDYFSKSGQWNQIAQYSDADVSFESLLIPADSLAGTVRLRFRFQSDPEYSDQDGRYDTDGAVVIDNLTVRDSGGIVDFQDFESEAVGALTTVDGDWSASVVPPFGDYAALFDGSTVLQEDSLVTNGTYLWGFFNGSTDTYACGGHPEQLAVPYSTFSQGWWSGVQNGIVSPVLALPSLSDTSQVLLEFDVYRDLASAFGVAYTCRVRSRVGGTWQGWHINPFNYAGDGKDWFRFVVDVISLVSPGATDIQVAIEAADRNYPTCHSHSPLVDNVRVSVVDGPQVFMVTNTNDAGPGSLRQALIDADTHGSGHIHFNIPGAGPHLIALDSALPIINYPMVIDGATQPGYAGTPLIRLGYTVPAAYMLYIWTDNATIRALHLSGSSYGGLEFMGDGNVVEACLISTTWRNITVGGDNNRIGGTGPGEGNELTGATTGVRVHSGTGNTIRGNRIHDHTALGIDLVPDGVTANDPLDADTGPNDLQNDPVLSNADVSTATIQGALDSAPSTQYEIDFYASSACDPSGYGEGERYLGSTTVTTDGSGHALFAPVVPGFAFGEAITATATDPAGNTSEFSACVFGSYSVPTFIVTNTNDFGAGSLRQAILDANAGADLNAIVFNIPGTGPHTIAPTAALPRITERVVIDGYTQPGSAKNTNGDGLGSNAVLMVELNGYLTESGNGLRVTNVDSCVIRGLVVNNFVTSSGIGLVGSWNVVEGCYMGTDPTGTSAKPNYIGIYVTGSGSAHNLIGGADPAARNVISGNSVEGVLLDNSSYSRVQGNFVGVDASGTSALGNGYYGIRVDQSTFDVIDGNVISANGRGVAFFGPTVTSNESVRANRIGTDVTGTAPLGNATDGIWINITTGNGELMRVGMPGYGNLIAYNGGAGVNVVLPSTGYANVSSNTIYSNDRGVVVTESGATGAIVDILSNEISANTGLGIDLGDDGVTANDAQDADTGPNGLQNYPVLTSATGSGGQVTITGSLNSTPDTYFEIQFYSSPSCDPSGYGEGAARLKGDEVITDASGNAVIDLTFSGNIPGGHYVTATARPSVTGGTSEFSACVEYINTTTGSGVVVVPVDETTGESPVTLTFDNVTGSGNTTLTIEDAGPPVPGGFIVGDSATYWNLSTTAAYTDSIEVCFSYDEAALPGAESDLAILHYDTTLVPDAWVDVTVSVDTLTNVACCRTAPLSPFVLAVPHPLVGVEEEESPTPAQFVLRQNIPNPFNPTTVIGYEVPAGGAEVTIVIYDVRGRRVRVLVDEYRSPGRYQVPWDGRNGRGERVATGVYFYRMRAGSFAQTRKMVLLK